MKTVGIGLDMQCVAHLPTAKTGERPARLEAVSGAILAAEAEGLPLDRLAPRLAEADEILLVHPEEHLALVDEASRTRVPLDVDTQVSERSFECGLRAVGLAIDATRGILEGRFQRAFVATRPPGHHALASQAMGFCLFNNVAIAARWARRHGGIRRIAIIDFDVHHGNGTQDIFARDPDTLFISSHQLPCYPGTGHARELGKGAGAGSTLNCPMPPGTGDASYDAFYGQVVGRVVDAFAPELILVSAGFDLMAGDPLAEQQVTPRGVRTIADHLVAVAAGSAGGKIGFFLEGGYDLDNLRSGTRECLGALSSDGEGVSLPAWAPERLGRAAAHVPIWRGAFRL